MLSCIVCGGQTSVVTPWVIHESVMADLALKHLLQHDAQAQALVICNISMLLQRLSKGETDHVAAISAPYLSGTPSPAGAVPTGRSLPC